MPRISTRDVADQLNQDLIMAGDASEESPRVQTRQVTRALNVLGFEIEPRGRQNKSFLKTGASFDKVYSVALRKYGDSSGVNRQGEQEPAVNSSVNQDIATTASASETIDES